MPKKKNRDNSAERVEQTEWKIKQSRKCHTYSYRPHPQRHCEKWGVRMGGETRTNKQ